jgi:hypothetical protein
VTDLPAVRHSVPVGVGAPRIRASAVLGTIDEAIPVGVAASIASEVGVEAFLALPTVGDAVTVPIASTSQRNRRRRREAEDGNDPGQPARCRHNATLLRVDG